MRYEFAPTRNWTAPGYFNFNPPQSTQPQSEYTAKIFATFDALSDYLQDQANLFDDTFRLWQTRDYSAISPNVDSYLYKLAQNINFSPFNFSMPILAKLLGYLYSPRPETLSDCFAQLFNLLLDIGWISSFGTIATGPARPAVYAESLLLYSNSVSAPALPDDTQYISRLWTAPDGFTKAPASSTWMLRGVLYSISGQNYIEWHGPFTTGSVATYYQSADIAGLPVSANDNDICAVEDDGTGDTGSIYFYDGGSWFKCSTENALQGSVYAPISDGTASEVFALNDPDLTSNTPVPPLGPTQGYGMFGIYGAFPGITAITAALELTADGNANLATITSFFRKIKPALIRLSVYVIYDSVATTIIINDQNAVEVLT